MEGFDDGAEEKGLLVVSGGILERGLEGSVNARDRAVSGALIEDCLWGNLSITRRMKFQVFLEVCVAEVTLDSRVSDAKQMRVAGLPPRPHLLRHRNPG